MKRIILKSASLMIAIIILLSGITNTLGFFADQRKSLPSPLSASMNIANNFVDVANEIELRKAVTASEYNSISTTSDPTTRKIIRPTQNITLSDNLIITRDCHLDLNGKTLSLNTYTLTILHSYYGSFVIANGNISALSPNPNIFINTQNAIVKVDSTVNLLSNAAVQIIQSNPNLVVNGAMNNVVNVLREDRFTTGLFEDVSDLGIIDLPVNEYCTFTHATTGEHRCCYFVSDIDLPTNYYLYDAEITYTTNDSALSPLGKFNISGVAQQKEVTLTVNISFGGVTATKDFKIHLINPEYDEGLNKAAVAVLAQNLGIYKNESGVHEFEGSVSIPEMNLNFNSQYSYETSSSITGAPILYDTNSLNISNNLNFSKEVDGAFILSPSSDSKYLKIISSKNGFSASQIIEISGKGGANIKDNYTTADSIMMNIFGGRSINVQNDESAAGQNGYTTQFLPIYNIGDTNPYQDKGLISLDFDKILINNIDGTYVVDDTNSSINGGYIFKADAGLSPSQLPNTLQSVFVRATFLFYDLVNPALVQTIIKNIPVKYIEQGTGLMDFDPYFTHFDRIISSKTGGFTYKDFTFPASYGASSPYIRFIVEGDIDGAITITPSAPTQPYTGEYQFTIDRTKLSKIDRQITLRYQYCFADPANPANWRNYTTNVSTFMLPGVVRNDSTGIPDVNLYKNIYDLYQSSGSQDLFNIVTDINNNKLILSSRLSREVTMLDLSYTTGITTYKGLELLTGLKGLNLKTSALKAMTITAKISQIQSYVSPLTQLEYLNLADNALKDGDASFFGISNRTQIWNALKLLINLKELHIEDNTFWEFGTLETFKNLEKAYIYGSSTNFLYGPKGVMSYIVFNRMLRNNPSVLIYNDISNPTKAYTMDINGADYIRFMKISNVEYQNKLPQNVPIYRIWQQNQSDTTPGTLYMSKTLSDYGLDDKSVTVLLKTYTPKIEIIPNIDTPNNITYENATSFTIKYTYYTKPNWFTVNTIEITSTFEIERIPAI